MTNGLCTDRHYNIPIAKAGDKKVENQVPLNLVLGCVCSDFINKYRKVTR